jgi:WD40 repeat protein
LSDAAVVDTARKEAPAAGDVEQPERPDVFISYSRHDQDFVRRLATELEGRGLDVWVDWEDIRKGADWRAKVEGGIDSARTVVPVLTDAFARSAVCADEIEHAVQNNKRLVPIVVGEVARANLRGELTAPNWIIFREEEEFSARAGEVVDAVESDPEWLDQHARLLVRAREWKRAGDNPSFLLRGSDLGAAETWLAEQGSHREAATPLHAEYIVASRGAAQRRQRITLGAILVALVVALVLAAAAVWQWREAVRQSHVSRSRELAASAIAQLPNDPELSVALAREAARANTTPEAVDALRTSLAQSHVLRTLRGHRGRIAQADLAAAGGRLITGSGDGTARVWKPATGETIAVLRGHRKPLNGVELSQDGTRALTVATDGTARTWDAATGRQLAVIRIAGTQPRARLSADGRMALVTGGGRRVELRNAARGTLLRRLTGIRGSVTSIAFSPNGTRVAAATGDFDGFVRIWDVRTGRLVQQLHEKSKIDPDDNAGLDEIAFNHTGKRVAAITTEFGVVVWDVASGRKVMEDGGVDSPLAITSIALSPNGRLLAGGTLDGVTEVWQVSNGLVLSTLRGHEQQITAVAFDPESKLLATASIDNTARIWRARTGEEVAWLRGHDGAVWSAEFAPDGRTIVTAAEDGTARVWSASGERSTGILRGHTEPLREAVFSPDGRRIVTASEDARARLWDAQTLQPLAWLEHDDQVRHAEFSPDGSLLLTSGPDGIRLWNGESGRRVAILRGHRDNVDSAHFSADGKQIVSASLDGSGALWEVPSGTRRARLRGHSDSVFDAAFSPDGEVAATASADGSARLWNVETAKQVRALPQPPSTWRVVFSPNGRVLATSGEDATVRLWDPASGRLLRVLDAGQVGIVRFSPDGTLLLTAGDNSNLELWRVADGRPAGVLRGHRSQVLSAEFDADGRYVVTTALDNSVRVWEVATAKQLARLNFIGSAHHAEFDPRGRRILAAGDNGTAQLFDCAVCGTLDDLLAAAARARPRTAGERGRYLHESLR